MKGGKEGKQIWRMRITSFSFIYNVYGRAGYINSDRLSLVNESRQAARTKVGS